MNPGLEKQIEKAFISGAEFGNIFDSEEEMLVRINEAFLTFLNDNESNKIISYKDYLKEINKNLN